MTTLVLAGGPVVFNPEPLAPFIDAFVIGEGGAVHPGNLNTVQDVRGRAHKGASLRTPGAVGVQILGSILFLQRGIHSE